MEVRNEITKNLTDLWATVTDKFLEVFLGIVQLTLNNNIETIHTGRFFVCFFFARPEVKMLGKTSSFPSFVCNFPVLMIFSPCELLFDCEEFCCVISTNHFSFCVRKTYYSSSVVETCGFKR